MPPYNEVGLGAAIYFSIVLLRRAVRDNTVTRLMEDLSRSIRRSEDICDDDSKEADYIEDLIGTSFVILQTKIRRVTMKALALNDEVKVFSLHTITSFEKQRAVLALDEDYRGTGSTLVELIWDVGNYFKHQDEWLLEVWDEETKGEASWIKNARRTRKSVQRVGIEWGSTGNMRTAYDFLGVRPYSQCEKLAEAVQHWADHVHNHAQTNLPLDPELLRRAREEVERHRRRISERNLIPNDR